MSKLTIIVVIVVAVFFSFLLYRKLIAPKSIFAEPLIPAPLYEPGINKPASLPTTSFTPTTTSRGTTTPR